MGLRALARCRHGHGRYGHDRVSHDPGRHGNHGAGERAMERDRVRVRVCHVGSDDGRHDGAFSGADDPDVRPRGSTGEVCGQAARRNRLVCRRLFRGLDRLFSSSDLCPMGVRTDGFA